MISLSVIIVGIIAVLVVVGIAGWLILQGRKFKLNEPAPGEKPEWMRAEPPAETLEALKMEGKPVALYNVEQGENLAAPFAEQIEDIVHASLKADPFLKSILVDFGTAPDGSLEFNINGTKYPNLDAIPEGRVKIIIMQAIDTYNRSNN